MPIDLAAIEAREKVATNRPWEEEWRPINGFEGRYDVSDMGRVRSYIRPGNHKQKLNISPRIMSETKTKPYKSVALKISKDSWSGYTSRRIHRLVLEAFKDPCPENYEAVHLNGDHSDNRLSNLVWVTHKENEKHKQEHGTNPQGERNGAARLVGWQVEEIKYLLGRGITQAKLARLFDVSRDTINAIASGECWQHIPPRSDIPALIAEVKRLQAALKYLQEMMEGQRERGRQLVVEQLGPRRAAELLKEVEDA